MAKARTTATKISRAIELTRAISMPGSLMNTTGGALDVRYAAANQADRVGIPQASRYEGLQVFQQDTKTLYILKDNSTPEGVWEAVALGGSVAEDLSSVIEQVTQLEQKVTAQGEEITANAGAIEELGGRVDGIDTEIEGIKEAATALGEKVTANEGEIAAAKGRLDGVEGRLDIVEPKLDAVVAESAQNKLDIAEVKQTVESNKTATDEAIAVVDKKVEDNKVATDEAIAAVEGKATENASAITALDQKVDTKVGELEAKDAEQDQEIAKLKETVTNKNNNTIVVNTFEEIAGANPEPKAGDLAYVLDEKKAYIFTMNAPTARVTKNGDVTGQWVIFDEITTELDLVEYLKKSEAEDTYRKLADQIAKVDLDEALVAEIDAKATTEAMNEALATKAEKEHVHEMTEVTGLQDALDGKSDVGHKHVVADITDFADEVESAIVAKDYATNTALTAVEGKVDTHIADDEKHLSEEQIQQLVDLGVKGAEGSLFNKVEALEAKKVEVDDETIVRSDDDIISVKEGVFAKEGHTHTVADITDLDEHLESKQYATQGALDNHVNNVDVHVTKEQKDNWEAHRNNLGIHVQVGGEAPAPNTFGLWLDLNADQVEPIVGTFKAGEATCR